MSSGGAIRGNDVPSSSAVARVVHQPGAQPHGRASVVREDGLDEFDGASRAQHGDLDVDLVDRDDAEDVVRKAADGERVVAPGIPIEFDGVRHQAERRCDVLFVRFPRAADMVRGPVGARSGSFEIAHRKLLVCPAPCNHGPFPRGDSPRPGNAEPGRGGQDEERIPSRWYRPAVRYAISVPGGECRHERILFTDRPEKYGGTTFPEWSCVGLRRTRDRRVLGRSGAHRVGDPARTPCRRPGENTVSEARREHRVGGPARTLPPRATGRSFRWTTPTRPPVLRDRRRGAIPPTAGDMATWIRTLVSGGVFDPGYLARAATGSGAQSHRITLCDG